MQQGKFSIVILALFLLHEIEEIALMKSWIAKNANYVEGRFPHIAKVIRKQMNKLNRSGFALIALQEFLLLSALLYYSVSSKNSHLWNGTIIMLVTHWGMTAIQSVWLLRLIPGTCSAVLGFCIVLFTYHQFTFVLLDFLYGIAIFVFAMLNLLFMHWFIGQNIRKVWYKKN